MANEKRLIDREKLLEKLEWLARNEDQFRQSVIGGVMHTIAVTPTVDAVEVVHGEWRKVYTCHGEQAWGYECNQCKADNQRATYYCPNCGAKMDGDVNV